jgi:phage replication initiation protein
LTPRGGGTFAAGGGAGAGDSANAAITDYLNFTVPPTAKPLDVPEFAETLRLGGFGHLGGLADRGKGKHGYDRSYVFDGGGAMLATGGQRGTTFVSVPGRACDRVSNWAAVVDLLGSLGARITRWDGAVDDYAGVHSVDDAVTIYKAGGFNSGGNAPQCNQQGNWIAPDGRGRTLYIGARRNGKLLRIYEKGKQQGSKESPWTRWELELHNRDRVIPLDVLLAPGRYVAGAYPCMAWVQGEASRIRTIRRSGQLGLRSLIRYARASYGKTINLAIEAGIAEAKLIKMMRRDGYPARIDLAGLDASLLDGPAER